MTQNIYWWKCLWKWHTCAALSSKWYR